MGRLTLNGMYEYDPSLFEGMVLPEDYDRDALLFEILQRSGQLYPYHQQPAMLKTAIRLWFARNFLNFDRTMDALISEYDPIENYNRFEDWTRTPDLSDTNTHTGQDSTAHSGNDSLVRTGQDTVADTGKDTTTHSGKDTTDHSGKDTTDNSGTDSTLHTFSNYKETVTEAGGKTTEEQVSAFDSGTYQASKKTIETYGDPSTRTTAKEITGSNTDALTHGHKEELTHGHKEELTHGHKEELEHGHTETTTRGTTDTQNFNSSEATTYGSTVTGRHTGTEKYTAHLHGNIAVTTTQQMITQEIELRKYDIYNDIAMRFEHEFLVQVY